ncbi:MAG: phenylacetate--CoA ligase [bacterium]|nr:phenylacetate--CoA ligase [bacterium]
MESNQLAGLRRLIEELQPANRFYGPRLRAAGLDGDLASLEVFRQRLPLTTKAELARDQEEEPPYGTNLTYPLERYVRLHQTSGTSGRPLRWLDTEDSWQWMLGAWVRVFEAAGLEPADRVFFPFSFGPFLGFWAAFDAAWRHGCLALPGGGMSSKARLNVLLENGATAVCATPTYAIRLAEVAAEEGIDLGGSAVRTVLVAGEPGGAVAAVRERISRLWGGARVMDHHGMTEVGPVSFPNSRFPGLLHVLESSYLAEVIDPANGRPAPRGEIGELVLSTLGRLGSPLLRYRTGDLVRVSQRDPGELGVAEMALEGGILARADDMVVVRGVNLYPSAVETVVREHQDVAEYRVRLRTGNAMTEVRVEIEPAAGCGDPPGLARRLEESFRTAFQLRIPVEPVAPGALPRFELKAKRWVEDLVE